MTDNNSVSSDESPISSFPSVELPSGPGQSSWELCRVVAKRHPIAVSILGLVSGTAVATLLGLPIGPAWAFLLIAMIILIILGDAFGYWAKQTTNTALHTADQAGTEGQSTTPRKAVRMACGICLLVGMAIISVWAGPDKRNPDSQTASQNYKLRKFLEDSRIRAARTAEYWRTAVTALHPFRFTDSTQVNSPLPASQFYQQKLNTFKSDLAIARAASTADVDTDLVEMVKGHFEIEEALLLQIDRYRQIANELDLEPFQGSAKEQSELMDKFLVGLTEEKLATQAPHIKQLLADMEALEDVRTQQLREIEIMQARLSERYSGQAFALPDLSSDTE